MWSFGSVPAAADGISAQVAVAKNHSHAKSVLVEWPTVPMTLERRRITSGQRSYVKRDQQLNLNERGHEYG
jgi:hypothetical protein